MSRLSNIYIIRMPFVQCQPWIIQGAACNTATRQLSCRRPKCCKMSSAITLPCHSSRGHPVVYTKLENSNSKPWTSQTLQANLLSCSTAVARTLRREPARPSPQSYKLKLVLKAHLPDLRGHSYRINIIIIHITTTVIRGLSYRIIFTVIATIIFCYYLLLITTKVLLFTASCYLDFQVF